MHTFLVMVFFALGAAAFLGAVACALQQECQRIDMLGRSNTAQDALRQSPAACMPEC